MIRDVLSDGVLTSFALVGLIMFVAVFLVMCAWILSRSRAEVHDWSRLPLSGDQDRPVNDRALDPPA